MIHPQRFNWSNPVYSETEVYKVKEPRGFVLYCPWVAPGGVRRGALIGEHVHIDARYLLGTYAVERMLATPSWQEEVVIR